MRASIQSRAFLVALVTTNKMAEDGQPAVGNTVVEEQPNEQGVSTDITRMQRCAMFQSPVQLEDEQDAPSDEGSGNPGPDSEVATGASTAEAGGDQLPEHLSEASDGGWDTDLEIEGERERERERGRERDMSSFFSW